MGDRMFASGGDSVHVGRRESPSGQESWEDRWNRGPDTGPREIPADVDATAGVVRRLQARVDRQRWLLGRMQSDPLQPEPAGLSELLETVARMRRDTESLLMLHGQDPGVPSPGPARRLGDVLADAAAAAEEPRRVDVRPVPAGDVTPAAATELLHVLAEVVDHVTAVYPGARVDVSCAAEAPGGVVVEVRADGATRHDPEGLGGRRALGAARRLAQRSRSGIVLRSPDGARDGGPVASIHCPGSVVTLDPVQARDPDRALAAWSARRQRESEPAAGGPPTADQPGTDARLPMRPDVARRRGAPDAPAIDPLAFGSDLHRSNPPRPADPQFAEPQFAEPQFAEPQPADLRYADPRDPLDPLSGPLPLDRILAESTLLEPPAPGSPRLDFTPSVPDLGHRTNGNGHNGHGAVYGSAPDYVPSAGSRVDELFGPMGDLAHDPADDDATPIFAAVASAWFREDAPEPARHDGQHRSPVNGHANGHTNGAAHAGPRHGGGLGGASGNGVSGNGASAGGGAHESGGPRNWETPSDVEWRAAAERAARPEPQDQTSNGLPRRRPGNQLVPPPRGGAGVPEVERPDRVPDRVRERLSTYQRGLQQGRHRAEPAPDSDPGDPAAW